MARYALIIGIAEYTGSFQSLESPVQNANAIADILDHVGNFDQVKRLPFRREAGQKDTGIVIRKPLPHETLVRELQKFLRDAANHEVLLYYSGHGFTKLDPLAQTLEGYLAPSDCQVEVNAAGQASVEKNGISLYGLNALINQHTFSSLVVILDCCNSGAFLESGMVRRDVTAFGYQRDYYLITACRASSASYEGKDYSLLTAAVLKGLAPENASPASGRVSGDRLFDLIGNELHNSRQEPLRMGWGRSITLVRYEQRQVAPTVEVSFNPANPYMGLKAFEPHQADYFFGREQAVRALLDRLADHRFLAVIGPSGCGKSSLVKAGLLPELKGDRLPGSHDWQIESITPGQYPLQVLANVLERHHADNKPVVLFVDQFEELFTLCPNEEEQRTFIKRLNDETNDPAKQTRIIVAMRGDFLDRCAKFQEAADLINSTAPTTYMVIPLTEARLVGDLEDSITCPAVLHGVSFEDGLVSRIVDDVVNQPGAMPLLQYALLQLWDNCIAPDRPSRQLMLQSYEAIDGVKGALQRWADQFYTNLSPADQLFVKELVGELVQIGDGNEVTRRRASWERLRAIASQEQLDRIIGRLVYQRLLVADDQTVEVAHEALLSEAKLIQGWIEENRDSIRLQQRLELYRHEWQDHDRSQNYLLDSGRLAAIDEWMEKKQPRLMPVDQEFIEQSRERRDRQFQAQLDQERRLREEAVRRELAEIEKKLEAEGRADAESGKAKEAEARAKAEKRGKQVAILAGILAVFTSGFGLVALLRQGEIKQQQALNVGTLIGKAETLLNTHSELEALEASVEALGELKKLGRETPSELARISTVISSVRERDRFQAHEGSIQGLSFSLDGKMLVSSGVDKSIKLWNMEGDRVSMFAKEQDAIVKLIRFSPNGNIFASADFNGKIKIWDKQGNEIGKFNYGDWVIDLSFSNDSRRIAASGRNKGVIIWDIKTGSVVKSIDVESINRDRSLKGGKIIYSLDFHPQKESVLVTTEEGNDIVLSDLKPSVTKFKHFSDNAQKGETTSVRFNPQGNIIASSKEQGIINLRNLDGELIGRANGKNDVFKSAQFSSDGKLIAAVSGNGIKFWKVDELLTKWQDQKQAPSTPNEIIKVNTGSVTRVSFRPSQPDNYPTDSNNYTVLASADASGTIRIWKIFDHEANSQKSDDLLSLLEKGCSILNSRKKQNSYVAENSLKVCTK